MSNAYIGTRDYQVNLMHALLSDPDFFADALSCLHCGDFMVPQVRLVFEICQRYWSEHNALPTPDILQNEVVKAMHDPELYSTLIKRDDAQLAYMVEIIGLARSALSHVDTSRSDYYRAELVEYVTVVRVNRIDGQELDAGKRLEALVKVSEDVKRIGGTTLHITSAMDEIPEEATVNANPVITGIIDLDASLEGGLYRGDVAMLVGGTGVGKTTGMVNFASANALVGNHSLFITLEVPEQRLRRTFQSITAHVDPKWFHLPKAQRPEDVKARLAYAASDAFPAGKCMDIVDMHDKTVGIADIEAAVSGWCKRMEADGVPPERRSLVCIDYLNIMSSEGLPDINRNSSRDQILVELIKQFRKIAAKYGVTVWTAQQLKDDARSKQVLKLSDIAYSSHLADWLNLCIGIAKAKQDGMGSEAAMMEEAGGRKTRRTDRMMKLTVLKSRDSAAVDAIIDFYQGPTLKFWKSRRYAQKADRDAASSDLERLFSDMSPSAQRM